MSGAPITPGLRALERTVRNRPEGSRNSTLFWATARGIEEGNDPQQVVDILGSAAIDAGLEPREIRATLKSGYNRGQQDLAATPSEGPATGPSAEWLERIREVQQAYWDANGIVTYDHENKAFVFISPEYEAKWQTDDMVLLATIEDWYEREHPTKEENTQHASGIVPISDYRASVPTVIPWIAERFVYRGGVTLVTAPAKAGKSTLMANLQRSRETNTTFIGVPVEQGPSLLITEEGGIAVVYKTEGLNNLYVYDRKASQGESFEDTLAKAQDWMAEHPDGMIFIDTLAIWAGIEDENDATSTTKAIAKVMLLAQTANAPVVIVHHSRKSGGSHGEAIRGSGAILATVDISIEMKRTDDPTSDERCLSTQGRVILPERYLLDFDRMTGTYTKIDLATRANSEIEMWLEGIPTNRSQPGLTRTELQALWDMTDTRKRTTRLLNVGRMHAEKTARGWQYWAIPPAFSRYLEADAGSDD